VNSVKTPLITVDCVVFYNNTVLLIKRKNDPFKNHLALPGGFVDVGETVESACLRELYEETNLKLNYSDLNLIGVYSEPDRDPKRATISIAYYAKLSAIEDVIAGDDALEANFFGDWEEKKLAFDHQSIINDAFTMHINE
jgi:8-oxo-dGTP diphosphatase